MRHASRTLLVIATLLGPVLLPFVAQAQATATVAEPTLAQAERMAAGLKQGMSSDDVRGLLGSPKRTALRTDGNSTSEITRGTLQWTYTWTGANGPAMLRIDFGSRLPQTWSVTRWEWVAY